MKMKARRARLEARQKLHDETCDSDGYIEKSGTTTLGYCDRGNPPRRHRRPGSVNK